MITGDDDQNKGRERAARRAAVRIGGALSAIIFLVACGSGQSSTGVIAAAQPLTATIQLHLPGWGDTPGKACELAAGSQGSYLSTGNEMQLQDEAGVILGRIKIPKGKLIKKFDCQVDLIFNNVTSGAQMYVLAMPDDNGWKFMPAEIDPGPTVIDMAAGDLPGPL